MYQQRRKIDYAKEPHGEISLEWQDDILIINAQGPFNPEGILLASKHFQECVENREHKSWVRLDISDQETLGEPFVINEIAKGYVWGFKNGCRAMALVYCNSLQKILCEKFIEENTLNVKLFYNQQDAEEWLATQ